MKVTTHAEGWVAARPETVFDVATALEMLPRAFLGCGPVPAIVAAEMADGGAMREGGIRLVRNADGSVIHEEITALRRPYRQAYRLTRGFRPPFAWLVRYAEGEWTFSPGPDGGTRMTWEFRFVLASPFAYPAMRLIAGRFMIRAQRECLGRIAAIAEDKERADASAPTIGGAVSAR